MESKSNQKDSNTSYIQDKLIDVLYSISKRGTLQEKVFGVVILTAMESMYKTPEDKNGIQDVLNRLLDIAKENGTIKEQYIEKDELSLVNIGMPNVMSLLDAYSQKDYDSPHVYTRLQKELENLDQESENKKSEYIDSRVKSLNEDIAEGKITVDDATKEVEKIIREANKKFGGEDEVEFLDVTVNYNNSLKNRFCESLYDLYSQYNTAVMNRYKSDKENRDNKDNYYAINVLKALMIVHRLGMTREMAEHMYEHNDFYHIVTKKVNEIAKKSGMSIEDFFKVDKTKIEEIEEMEKEILKDPEIDRNIKDLLDGINFN